SLISLVAPLLAWDGSPWLSKGSRDILTDGFVALYWLMASASPSLMLIPSWASAPVSAPKNPTFSDVPEGVAPPVPALAVVLLPPVLLLLELLHAARPSAAASPTAATALMPTGLANAIRSPPRTVPPL